MYAVPLFTTEEHLPPCISSEVDVALKTRQLKSDVDEYQKVTCTLDFYLFHREHHKGMYL